MKKFSAEVQLSREMSLLDATMSGVGAMIGAGIFVLTGIAAGWLIKRIVYQLCVLLRLERLLRSFRWGGEFSKAEIAETDRSQATQDQ